MVSALDKKLLRDLSRLKGQVLTISLVVACGIASFVTMQGTWSSLLHTRDTYYERHRFADVFMQLKRAPRALLGRIEALPGVAIAEGRVVERVLLPLPHQIEAATGTIISMPSSGESKLNAIFMRAGRMIEPRRPDEVIINESFALEHRFVPGSHFPAIINGTLRDLEVVGIAMSPEYVLAVPPGEFMPDNKRFGIIWMNEEAATAAFRMEGAFNDISVRLQPHASEQAVLTNLDHLLAPYGGLGAHGRDKQFSNFALTGELQQLEGLATIIPFIFLSVAAFLLNVVLSRLVHLQRSQIATLKAVGYSDMAIGVHYLKLVLVVVGIGSAIGLGSGAYLGRSMTRMYAEFYRFPILIYDLDARILGTGAIVSFVAALSGALLAVRRVVRLPPAEAMRPQAPADYRQSALERLGLHRLLSQSGIIVLRELRRRPWRFLFSSLAIAAAIAVMVLGRFSKDSFDYMLVELFHREQPAELAVDLREPIANDVERVLIHLPGALAVEGMRSVPVRYRVGQRWRDSALHGIKPDGELRVLINRDAERVYLPQTGITMTNKLAEVLGVEVGGLVTVEVREGQRQTLQATVTGLIDETAGMQGYMSEGELQKFLGETPMVNRIYIKVDLNYVSELHRRLKEMPTVAAVTHMQTVIDRYEEQTGNTMAVFTLILTFFAATIAVGVVYNNARVALSMRSRDLASLRVLGFTRGEISGILLSELAIQVIVAIPLGLWMGRQWCESVAATMDPETFRLPVIVSSETYAFAVTVALVSGIVSALLVRRKLDRLDLIGVLKTRE